MSEHKTTWSFRRKLLVLFLLFSLVPLGLVALVVYHTVQATYRNVLTDTFESTIHLEEQLLRQFLAGQISFVRSLAAQDILLSELERQYDGLSYNDRDIFVTLVSVRRENLFVEKVYILDQEGRVLISTATDEVGSIITDSRAFAVPMQERRSYVGSISLSSYNKRIIPIATPLIRKGDNSVIGVLVSELNSSVIQSVLESNRRTTQIDGATINSFAVDHEGLLLTPLSYAPRATPFNTAPVLSCREHSLDSSGTWTDYTGMPVVGAATCFTDDDLSFTLITEQDARAAFAIARDLGIVIFMISAGVAVLVFLVIIRVSRSVTDPIQALRRGTRELGRGNFDYPIEVATGDEIEELAHDFDTARQRLRKAREQEKALAQKQSDFISIAAHQLRTPLTSIKWAIQYFLNGKTNLDDRQRQDMARTLHSTNELIVIVNDLLNVSRIEEDKFEYEFTEGDLPIFVEHISHEVHARYSDKTINLNITPIPEQLPRVQFDREKLSIAVINIIDNAMKYTPHGGTISISYMRTGDTVIVRVQDTGIGIPADQLDHVSEKFFRSENARHMHVNGSGLGLFAARKIVEAHAGRLFIESIEGEGTAIEIWLPIHHNIARHPTT